MKRSLPSLALLAYCGIWLLSVPACSGPKPPAEPAMPALPPLQLQEFLPVLEALAAKLPQPTEAEQRELKELGDIALQLVDADPRTAGRAERTLLEHPRASFVLEPALQHTEIATRRRAAWLCGQSGQSILQLPLLLRLKYELDPEAVLWVADALQRLGNDSGLAWLDAAMNQEATAQQAGTMAIEICRERNVTLAEAPTYAQLQEALRKLTADWLRTALRDPPCHHAEHAAAADRRCALRDHAQWQTAAATPAAHPARRRALPAHDGLAGARRTRPLRFAHWRCGAAAARRSPDQFLRGPHPRGSRL
jgi:hypothetical protein